MRVMQPHRHRCGRRPPARRARRSARRPGRRGGLPARCTVTGSSMRALRRSSRRISAVVGASVHHPTRRAPPHRRSVPRSRRRQAAAPAPAATGEPMPSLSAARSPYVTIAAISRSGNRRRRGRSTRVTTSSRSSESAARSPRATCRGRGRPARSERIRHERLQSRLDLITERTAPGRVERGLPRHANTRRSERRRGVAPTPHPTQCLPILPPNVASGPPGDVPDYTDSQRDRNREQGPFRRFRLETQR